MVEETGNVKVPPPPRLTGDAEKDASSLNRWIWDFYRIGVLEGEFLTVTSQTTDATETDVTDLPDPANTTASQAQQTANDAFTLAAIAAAVVSTMEAGTFVIGELLTSGAVVLGTEQPDTDYNVIAVVTDISGAPATAARLITDIAKTTTGFTVTISSAPGSGTSVTYSYIVMR